MRVSVLPCAGRHTGLSSRVGDRSDTHYATSAPPLEIHPFPPYLPNPLFHPYLRIPSLLAKRPFPAFPVNASFSPIPTFPPIHSFLPIPPYLLFCPI